MKLTKGKKENGSQNKLAFISICENKISKLIFNRTQNNKTWSKKKKILPTLILLKDFD